MKSISILVDPMCGQLSVNQLLRMDFAGCTPYMHVSWTPKSLQVRELNPYLKDGGSGVPPAEAAAAKAAEAAAKQRRPPAVGDGGSSWRLKALQRAQASAAEQGLDVSEVRGPVT